MSRQSSHDHALRDQHESSEGGIGKGVTALADFCATLNYFWRGFHHKAFRDTWAPWRKLARQRQKATEAARVQVVKILDQNFLNPIVNVDIIFKGTWETHGHNSNIAVGCILELYSGLVLDHVELSRYCRGCQGAPDPDDDGCADWVFNHKYLKNIGRNAGQMEAEAAPILLILEVSGEEWAELHNHCFRRRQPHLPCFDAGALLCQSRRAPAPQDYGCLKIEDCLNHVHKRMGAALCPLVEKWTKGEFFLEEKGS